MATVYRAIQIKLNRVVALKVLDPLLARDPAFTSRFLKEALTVAQLNHPSIVIVHDVGEAGGLHYIAMELIEGPSLKEVLKEEGSLCLLQLKLPSDSSSKSPLIPVQSIHPLLWKGSSFTWILEQVGTLLQWVDTLVQWASLLALVHHKGYVSFDFNIRGGGIANRRLSKRSIKEVLRLKYEAGLSNRAIARSCGIKNVRQVPPKHENNKGKGAKGEQGNQHSPQSQPNGQK